MDGRENKFTVRRFYNIINNNNHNKARKVFAGKQICILNVEVLTYIGTGMQATIMCIMP